MMIMIKKVSFCSNAITAGQLYEGILMFISVHYSIKWFYSTFNENKECVWENKMSKNKDIKLH